MKTPRDRCRRGHLYAEVGFTWQKSGEGQPYRACCRCSSERKAAWRSKAEAASVEPGS